MLTPAVIADFQVGGGFCFKNLEKQIEVTIYAVPPIPKTVKEEYMKFIIL